MVNIAIFGEKDFIDYYKIGGFESYIRRIAHQMSDIGDNVNYIMIGDKVDSKNVPNSNINLCYFNNYQNAVSELKNNRFDHVIYTRLSGFNRIKFTFMDIYKINSSRVSYMSLSWSDSIHKRLFILLESILIRKKGYIICSSIRLYYFFSQYYKNVKFLLPIVTDSYYINPDMKNMKDHLVVTYFGMLSDSKYVNKIIDIFERLKNNKKVICNVFAIHNKNNSISVKAHEWFKNQKDIIYQEINKEIYSEAVEKEAIKIFHNSDIVLQPYKTLKNTLDTPLIMLEAMASSCLIITTPRGDICKIYNTKKYIIKDAKYVASTLSIINEITNREINEDRGRIKSNIDTLLKNNNPKKVILELFGSCSNES